MRLGVRGKVFWISAALILLAGIPCELYLERELGHREQHALEEALLRDARIARTALAERGAVRDPNDALALDRIADELGAASRARITLIAHDGTVIGDSALNQAGLRTEENHSQRPEVLSALAGDETVVRRFSTTVNAELFYAAVPWPERAGVIRAATPLSTLDDLATHRRTLLLWTGALGVLIALLFSAIAAQVAASKLDALATGARAVLASGSKRIPISDDEIGRIAGSVNELAEERAKTIAELVKERDRRNAVLQGVNEGLIAIDHESRVELMNPAARMLLGLTTTEPEGRKLVEAIRIPALIELAERGKREAATVEFTHGDPPRHLLGQTTPLRATGGSVLVLHDVTDLRTMEAMRRDLVANVSHELRTPVSIIRANAETLLDGALDDPPQARTFVQAMLRHAERLSNLLSDLLDLARIEGGAYHLVLENVGLRQAAQRALDTLQRTAKARNVAVRIAIDGDLAAYADAQALDQVLVNLLDNAIKYSFEGGAVELSGSLDGERVRMVVSDDGPGIQERHRSRVFERFYRVDAGRSRAVGGTGLGLSIVKHLVSLMHGAVGVDPVAPHGSAFWVSLPGARANSKALADGAAA